MKEHPSRPISLTIAHITLCISVLLFPLGQLGRIPVADGTVYLYEIFMGVAFLAMVWDSAKYHYVSQSKKEKEVESRRTMPLLLFLSVLFVTLFFSLFRYDALENITALLYALRLAVYSTFLVLLLNPLIRKEIAGPALITCMVLSGVVVIMGSVIQYLYYPDLRNVWYQGWDPHYFRLFGTFLEPVILAGVFGIGTAILLANKQLKSWIRWGGISVLAVLLMLTFSRAALLAYALMIIVFAIRNKMWIPILAGVVVFAGAYLVAPKPSGEGVNLLRTSTIQSRVADYQDGISVWKEQPLIGVGYNHIPFEKDIPFSYSSTGEQIPNNAQGAYHSSFVTILATGGIVLLSVYVWFWFCMARASEYYLYGIVFLSTLAFFDNVLLHPFLLYLTGVGSLVTPLSQRR